MIDIQIDYEFHACREVKTCNNAVVKKLRLKEIHNFVSHLTNSFSTNRRLTFSSPNCRL